MASGHAGALLSDALTQCPGPQKAKALAVCSAGRGRLAASRHRTNNPLGPAPPCAAPLRFCCCRMEVITPIQCKLLSLVTLVFGGLALAALIVETILQYLRVRYRWLSEQQRALSTLLCAEFVHAAA